MLNMETVDNFRTFERDEDGKELHMTDLVCDFCGEPSEVYIEITGLKAVCKNEGNGCPHILICKGCLSKGEQMWNAAFLKHAKRDRTEQESFLRGE